MLTPLKKLETLDLYNTAIEGKVEDLIPLKKLETLNLRDFLKGDSKITGGGLAELKRLHGRA